MPATPRRTDLAEGSWDDLFDFLDPARPAGGQPGRDTVAEARCLDIVRKLTCFFAGRRCPDAEDLAVETVLRVAARCRAVDVSGYPDRGGYFYGVARNVLHEWQRDVLRDSAKREGLRRDLTAAGTDSFAWKRKEAVDRCLETCLAKLTQRARRLILGYYGEEQGEKSAAHLGLANELGKSVNALRIEVHRIRKTLRECVAGCVQVVPDRARRVGGPAGD